MTPGRELRGTCMIVGVVLFSILAFHFAGWLGVTGVVATFCVWRAI